MPIPAAAGLLAATVHFFYGIPVQAWWVAIIWLVLVGLAGFLMVSTWRFWSGKEINLSRRHPFQMLFLHGDRAVCRRQVFPGGVVRHWRWSTCSPASGRGRRTRGPGGAGEDDQETIRRDCLIGRVAGS